METTRALEADRAGSKGLCCSQCPCDLPHVTCSSLLIVKISDYVCQQSDSTLNRLQVAWRLVSMQEMKTDAGHVNIQDGQ